MKPPYTASMKLIVRTLIASLCVAILGLWVTNINAGLEENGRMLREMSNDIHNLLAAREKGTSLMRGAVLDEDVEGLIHTRPKKLKAKEAGRERPPKDVEILPSASAANVRLPEICTQAADDQLKGALQAVCAADPEIVGPLWAEGIRLLGEQGLVEFLGRCVSLRSTFASHAVTIWGDGLDAIGHRGAVKEQANDVYNLKKCCFGLGNNAWIADFGSNLGATAVHMRILAPRSRIVAVEPSPWNYILLRLNFVQNFPRDVLDGRTTPMQGGLAPSFGMMHGSHFFGNAWASRRDDIFQNGSFIKGSPSDWALRASTEVGRFEAPLMTLPWILSTLKVPRFDLMKLDCEGCEWEVVLDGIVGGYWSNVVGRMIGELHALCQHGKGNLKGGNIAECLPRGFNPGDARKVWLLLCENADIEMEWGCDEPKFASLGSDVAQSLTKRICRNPKKKKKWWNQENYDQLCTSAS